MPNKNEDLHSMVPDKAAIALLLIEVINNLEFEDGERLLEHALPMAQCIADLKARAKKSGIPAIYVNDNYGRWQSNFNKLVDRCLDEDVRGKSLIELLKPGELDMERLQCEAT